jgi:hypothetical protein
MRSEVTRLRSDSQEPLKTRTGFGYPGPPPARYGLVSSPLHVSSLLFPCHGVCQLSISSFTAASSFIEVIAPRPSLLVFAVTAVTIVPAVTAVTRRAFVTRPEGHGATVGAVTAVTGRAFVTRPGGDMGRRGRSGRGSGIPLVFAVAAVTTVTAELRPARDVHLVG